MSQVLLVDGSFYVHSSHYAFANLYTNDGKAIGATYGITRIVLEFFKKDYEYIGIIFDSPVKNFRYSLYKDYKTTRAKIDHKLSEQFPDIFSIIEHLGFKSILIDGYEGDDIIGSLTKLFVSQGHKVTIATRDKDLYQLLAPSVKIIYKSTVVSMDNYQKFISVRPNQFIDYLALCGDKSDNIPGVRNIGPKTATYLLQEYDSIDNILNNIDHLSPKHKQYLEQDLENLRLSQKLATIKQDIDIHIHLEHLKRKVDKINYVALFMKFKELNLSQFASEIAKGLTGTFSFQRFHLENLDAILSIAQTKSTIAFYFSNQEFCFTMDGNMIYSLSLEQRHAVAINMLLSSCQNRVTYELKSMWLFFDIYHLDLNLMIHDIAIQSYVLDSTDIPHSLDHIAIKYLNLSNISDIFHQVYVIFALNKILLSLLLQDAPLAHIYQHIDLPLAKVLFYMENAGIKINRDLMASLDQELACQQHHLKLTCYSYANTEFNLDSQKQVADVLFHVLDLKTKDIFVKNATSKNILRYLAGFHEFPKLLMEYRHVSKLRSNYTNKLPQLIRPDTGKIHSMFHQCSTSTGRLSSSNPNLQNIPAEDRIRSCFIPEKQHSFIIADYSQIELRVLAHMSQDEMLIKAFQEDRDIHQETAMHLFQLKECDVTTFHRNVAKKVNFGIVYGIHAKGLAKNLNISVEQSQLYIDQYFDKYQQIREYMANSIAFAHHHGYVETISKRRIYTSGIHSHNQQISRTAERLAINAPIQGTAADIIKLSMIYLCNLKTDINLSLKLILQIHDELLFEVPNDFIQESITYIKESMEDIVKLSIPLKVNISSNNCWRK